VEYLEKDLVPKFAKTNMQNISVPEKQGKNIDNFWKDVTNCVKNVIKLFVILRRGVSIKV